MKIWPAELWRAVLRTPHLEQLTGLRGNLAADCVALDRHLPGQRALSTPIRTLYSSAALPAISIHAETPRCELRVSLEALLANARHMSGSDSAAMVLRAW